MIDEILRHLQTHGTCDANELAAIMDTTPRHVAMVLNFLLKYALIHRNFLGVRLSPVTIRFLHDLDVAAFPKD